MPKRVLPEGTTETIARLTREGWSASRIAEHLNVKERTVFRYRKRAGVAGPPSVTLKPAQIERIETLVGEGMPSNWVAEDVGCSTKTVYRHRPMGREAAREFQQAFAHILRNPVLLDLHREFAPRGAKKREGNRAA